MWVWQHVCQRKVPKDWTFLWKQDGCTKFVKAFGSCTLTRGKTFKCYPVLAICTCGKRSGWHPDSPLLMLMFQPTERGAIPLGMVIITQVKRKRVGQVEEKVWIQGCQPGIGQCKGFQWVEVIKGSCFYVGNWVVKNGQKEKICESSKQFWHDFRQDIVVQSEGLQILRKSSRFNVRYSVEAQVQGGQWFNSTEGILVNRRNLILFQVEIHAVWHMAEDSSRKRSDGIPCEPNPHCVTRNITWHLSETTVCSKKGSADLYVLISALLLVSTFSLCTRKHCCWNDKSEHWKY